MVNELCGFLGGDTDEVVARITGEMGDAAKALEFEKAARLRDRLESVERAIERQQMVAERVKISTSLVSPMTSWRHRCRCSSCVVDGLWAARVRARQG